MIGKLSLKDLGLRTDNLKSSILPYSFLTVLMLSAVWVLMEFLNRKLTSSLITLYHQIYFLWFLVIPLSILQELVFRGYLMAVLRKFFKKPETIILLNSLVFAFAHLIFPNQQIIFPGAFLVGLAFATIYYYYPNLVLISITHIIVNFAILPYCFFKLISC